MRHYDQKKNKSVVKMQNSYNHQDVNWQLKMHMKNLKRAQSIAHQENMLRKEHQTIASQIDSDISAMDRASHVTPTILKPEHELNRYNSE